MLAQAEAERQATGKAEVLRQKTRKDRRQRAFGCKATGLKGRKGPPKRRMILLGGRALRMPRNGARGAWRDIRG
jgi:hypothetical protein